jgi:hypothetical protein
MSFPREKVIGDGSRRSPGLRVRTRLSPLHAASFPGFFSNSKRFSVNGRECPRLQLRGSAGFAPASHSSGITPAYDHARTQFEKEQKQQPAKFTGPKKTSQTVRRSHGKVKFGDGDKMNRSFASLGDDRGVLTRDDMGFLALDDRKF